MWSIEQLTEEILSLPSASRAILAEKILESLEFDTDPEIQAVWVTEAKKRRDEIRGGDVQPIPGEEALAQVVGWVEERNPTSMSKLLGFASLNPTYK